MSEDRTQQLPDDGLRQILARFDSMDARFDSMDARFDSMDARLTTLEDKVDRRLQETRPIWEQVLTRLTGVETRLGKVEDEVYSLGRKFRVFNEDILKLQNRHEDLEERLNRMEADQTR